MSNKKSKPKGQKVQLTLEDFCAQELPTIADIVSFTNNFPISVYAESTIVKSPEVVFRGLMISHNRYLSEEYLLNYRHHELDMGMMIGVNNYRLPMVMMSLANRTFAEEPDKLITLPPYKNISAPVGPVIRSRRSMRRYSGNKMSLADLATILFYAQGVTGKLPLSNMPGSISLGQQPEVELRTAPSGGGLYPIGLYFIALNVDTLQQGSYLYVPSHHALKSIKTLGKDFQPNEMGQFGNEIDIAKANLLMVFVYRLLENSRKYGDSGLAYALIEAGEIAENIHLACTALRLGPCDIGGYAKHRLEQVLGLDGLSQHVVHLMVIGS